jgi:exonuclease III
VPTNQEQNQSKNKQLKIGTWNVRRGLIRRENEIKLILQSENIDILYLTETDTKKLNVDKYNLRGYTTVSQCCEDDNDTVRIIALVKDAQGLDIKVRHDLMSKTFPSIWLEAQDKHRAKSLIGGYYRQWSVNGKLTVPEQITQIEEFCEQINSAGKETKKIIVTGDANLCTKKWLAEDYDRKSVAQPLLHCLEQNGLRVQDIGMTFQADHLQPNGQVAESALDHVYTSRTIEDCIKTRKILYSSSDHLPVTTTYSLDMRKLRYNHMVTKRSYKGFTKEKWNKALEKQDWLDVEECSESGVDQMVKVFDRNIQAALDQVAPVRTFKIRSNHRFGLSDGVKELMKRREKARAEIRSASTKEKGILLQQYKTLRNQVTSKIRKENTDYNNNRIEEATNEKELWSIANDVLNPRKDTEWNVVDRDGENVKDESKVAEIFNEFFINKVEQLKKGIDPTIVEDPMVRLRGKMKNNKTKLEFNTITEKQLTKHLKNLNKKKSSGLDGLSQENLILGATNLIAPLTKIVNQSIVEGEFPKEWKEAVVTPILKKGNPQLLSNYRPVSCLPAASKVLEIVVCSQLSDYLESNKLLPSNQHGFRPRRSTMTAWQEIQLDWATKNESNLVTGVLLWDLSAAFDTLDCEGVCDKMEMFGVQARSIKWIRSFLSGRSQRVKIGSKISVSRLVPTGVPQGGVLSPLIFVLFVSDLQDWLKHSTAATYADDTTTGTSGYNLAETLAKLEEDASKVLSYMASNGLVANAKKTAFLLLNAARNKDVVNVKIGTEVVRREESAVLLGIRFQDDLQWKAQIFGKGGIISSLNSRLYIIRRLKSHLSMRAVLKLVDGLFTSKIRYGLQLLGRVRTRAEDPECADLNAIQLIQNKLLRSLNGTLLKDRVTTSSLLVKFGVLSVNQLNAQIKLLEIWKAINVEGYPLKIEQQTVQAEGATTRASRRGRPISVGKSKIVQRTSTSDAIRIWNLAPAMVTDSKSIWQVKSQIKTYVKTLPV